MSRQRRRLLQGALGASVLPAWAVADMPADNGKKVLRVAFRNAETSLDPARISDSYSRMVTPHIFEALYGYDHLARPYKIRPLTAAGMPEVSPDFKVWVVRVQPGIHFADDPAFKGQRRELVAQDFIYAIQRTLDPVNRSPIASNVLEVRIAGLKEAHDRAQASGRFDYDRPIAGLQALGRHALRFTLEEPRPRFIEFLAQSDVLGGTAREVVEFHGERIAEHPVGTGPFRLKSWRRSSRIVLERNPLYRERYYDAQPAPDDADGQALLARLKGRRLPMVDEVEVNVISEEQPLWLSFLRREIDGLVCITGALPGSYINQAAPAGKLAPHLARRGVQMRRQLNADVAITYFNMEHPVVGGYTPDKVALRRAISLAYDIGREIRQVRRGQGVPAQSQVLPHVSGYDPAFKSEMGDFDLQRARALLDLFGYVDRDGDGWREQPDGSALRLVMATEPEAVNREYNELWRKSMAAVGLRMDFDTAQWAENMKGAYAGRHMMWFLGSTADSPDGQDGLSRLHGPQSGNANLARFKLDAFDRLFDQLSVLPDGPERDALFVKAKRLAVAYMPYKAHVHRLGTDLMHPWLIGFRRPLFWSEWWHMADIDPELKQRHDHA